MTRTLKILLCVTVLTQVSACSIDEPTWVSSSRVEVHEEGFSDTFDTTSLDKGMLRAIGVNYYRYGNGPMDVTVSYNKNSGSNSQQRASSEAKRIESELKRNGVRNLRVGTAPNENTGDVSKTRISFPALTAKPPQDCGLMPGYVDAQTGTPEDAEGGPKGYAMGCTIETMMAKQIARPGDLLGRPGFETNADARRQEAVIWQRGYYGNKSFDPLNGESASDSK